MVLCWNLTAEGEGDRRPAVRLGISYVRTIGADLAKHIAGGRPYSGMEDFVRRSGVNVAQAEALATAGAFECFGSARRAALWAAGALAQAGPGLETETAQPHLGSRTRDRRPKISPESNRRRYWGAGRTGRARRAR